MGRVNRIPLLLNSISTYLRSGGLLRFTFAGGGRYVAEVQGLAATVGAIEYVGEISAEDAATLVARHRWALMPIDDEVARYAFPSKSSGCVLAGTPIFAICGSQTSVARWIEKHQVGIVCEPDLDALVKGFFDLEAKSMVLEADSELVRALSVPRFSERLFSITCGVDRVAC
jgi:hypothetical protein